MTSELVISFDFELGWGVLESERWQKREAAGVYTAMRPLFPELLNLFEGLDLTTTWAVVGAFRTTIDR